MNIRLYPESSDRPLGDYDYAQCAVIDGSRIFLITQTGKRIFSTLRFKITLHDGDSVAEASNPNKNDIKIMGIPKPKKEVTVNGKQPANPIRKSTVQSPVPESSSHAGADSDEVFRVRSRRSRRTNRDGRNESGSLPFAPAGPNEDF